jgi:hypothetical protein
LLDEQSLDPLFATSMIDQHKGDVQQQSDIFQHKINFFNNWVIFYNKKVMLA